MAEQQQVRGIVVVEVARIHDDGRGKWQRVSKGHERT
jgi:hypothetical protein